METEVINLDDKIEALKVSMSDFIDKLAYSYQYHLRIIVDKMPPFPVNYDWVKHDSFIEVSDTSWKDHTGWSKPDLEFKGIEVRYLWKQFRPKAVKND